jgi:hypothetical protein
MKTKVHPLAADDKPQGMIRFIHSDGEEHAFYYCVNSLSGDSLCWFDDDPPSVNDPRAYVLSVLRDIREKAKVLKDAGDL